MCIYRLSDSSSASNDPHRAGRVLTYDTKAHVVTQGLGRNKNVFPSGVVCDDCNRYFGRTLEPALIRHPTLAYDMQRLGVPGKDGGPRTILGNYRRDSAGAVLVPMVPPQDWRQRGEGVDIGLLPILAPEFNQLEFRRGLHLLAFNVLALLHATGQVSDPIYDPRHPRYDAVRRYIRPRGRTEAWLFLERYDPPAVGGKVGYELLDAGGMIIGKIRAYSFEFYVDLTNTGNLASWAEEQGITPIRPIPPDVRYPASPTMYEVPPESRWWLCFDNGKIRLLGPKGELIELTPVAEPSPTKKAG
jgi:hypothetical protein